MDAAEVARGLVEAGFFCQELPPDEIVRKLTGSDALLECVERGGAAFPGRVCGISFWVSIGPELGILGLPSGNLYACLEPQSVLPGAQAILGGAFHPKGRAPYGLPEAAQRQFGLRACSLFAVCRDNASERLRDVAVGTLEPAMTQADFVACLVRHGGEVGWTTGGIGKARLGEAAFLTRFGPNGAGHTIHPVLFFGDVRDTPDHGVVLELLTKDLGCAVFDEGWGNRVHPDDPYYKRPETGHGPDAPANWRP